MYKASDSFYESLAAIAKELPEISLQTATPISKTAFRILASHPDTPYHLDAETYEKMIGAATGNKFRLVESTLQPINLENTYNTKHVSAIIEANTIVEDFDEEKVKNNMKVVTANVFEDNENSIWKVVEANGKKMLVQTEAEDYERIINSRIMARPSMSVASVTFHGIVPKNGDFTTYYDTNRMCIASGFALHFDGKINIADRKLGDWVNVSSEQVVETIAGASLDETHSPMKRLNETRAYGEMNEEDFTPQAARDVMSYFRNLYAGTDYFNGLDTLVAERRRYAQVERPLIQNRY